MTRTFAAILLSAAVASPAAAATYSAKLAAPVTDRFITRDIVWQCASDACTGATETSRPLVLCQSLAKRAGRVESFAADGQALAAAELDRCNKSAKASASSEIADAR